MRSQRNQIRQATLANRIRKRLCKRKDEYFSLLLPFSVVEISSLSGQRASCHTVSRSDFVPVFKLKPWISRETKRARRSRMETVEEHENVSGWRSSFREKDPTGSRNIMTTEFGKSLEYNHSIESDSKLREE